MPVKTTLSFTERHRAFLSRAVEQGVYATASAAVAAAIEEMIRDEREREAALEGIADEVRRRMATPRDAFLDETDAFASARAALADHNGT